MIKVIVLLALSFLTFANADGQNEEKQAVGVAAPIGTVTLKKQTFASTGKLTGISNIFFEKTNDAGPQIARGWKDVEVAKVVDSPRYLPVIAVRYKDAAGETKYVVDTNGDMDLNRERPLVFHTQADLQVADFEIQIKFAKPSVAGPNAVKTLAYQMFLSGDGYVYARVSEYRQGVIKIGERSYNVLLRPISKNSPAFDLSGDTKCMIDLNQDGEFTERWQLNEKGDVVANEEINITGPFAIGAEKFKITSLDGLGTRLSIAPTNEETSIATGFRAPDFSLMGVDNGSFNLQDLRGKIVLLEFWSVSCGFCQRILPEVNALLQKNKGDDFVAVDIAKESDADQVNKYLAKNPREARVALNNGQIWPVYNRQIITPTFYLLDKQGVIRLSGYGAYSDIIKIIDKKIEEIRFVH